MYVTFVLQVEQNFDVVRNHDLFFPGSISCRNRTTDILTYASYSRVTHACIEYSNKCSVVTDGHGLHQVRDSSDRLLQGHELLRYLRPMRVLMVAP